MKIVTWNCNGAFRNKFEYLIELDMDLCIIQECENPALTKHKDFVKWANNFLWIGDYNHKGLGIFAKESWKLEKLKWTCTFKNCEVKHFLPCSVNNHFKILGVWAHRNDSPTFGYIGQFWKYLQINKANLNDIIIGGDFNSSGIWYQRDIWWNHSDVVQELRAEGIESLYHKFFNEDHGKELKPTFFLYRKIEKPYHIDYLFGSEKFLRRIRQVEVGHPDKWLRLSDHLPLICIFDNKFD